MIEKATLHRLWRDHPRMLVAFALAAAITLFFVVRIMMSVIYWANPAHHNEVVRPWMTVGYIAQSWDLDAREIDMLADLPLPEVKGRPQPLSEIARDRGVPVADVIAQVEAAIATLRQKEKHK